MCGNFRTFMWVAVQTPDLFGVTLFKAGVEDSIRHPGPLSE